MKTEICVKNISGSFTEIVPYRAYEKKEADWRDGLVTGNGEQGAVCACSPYSETIILQNMHFIMPSRQSRVVPPELTAELHEARQAVINFDDQWNVHGRKRTYLYCFHPGPQLRIRIPENKILSYVRETDYRTAEARVTYSDRLGAWTRSAFTSREDGVTITRISKSDTGSAILADISIDDIASMKGYGGGVFSSGKKRDEELMQYKKLIDADRGTIALVAHYPSCEGSELSEGGYAGVTKIISRGGTREILRENDSGEEINVGDIKNPAIRISGADEVILISKTARTHRMGAIEDFAATDEYDIISELSREIEKTAIKYTDGENHFSYEAALSPHRERQSALFDSVTFSLGKKAASTPCEELIERQKSNAGLLDDLIERAYAQGRYAQICCAGHSAPRLCGLWTGEWNPGWNGAYTMDANVNIQVSGMNTGAVYDAAIGYIYFVLRQLSDWEGNAAMAYGMKGALLVPVNTDGDRAILVEYDQHYPFQYWNAGASWMILPIYEFWQCYGNREIPVSAEIAQLYHTDTLDLERDILLPLLTKQANFWEQLCTAEYFTDVSGKARYEQGKKELLEGEKYLIIPSYSPENKPKGYRSTITANAAMDISAARDGLAMLTEIERAIGSAASGAERAPFTPRDAERRSRLLARLPDYKFDETGALREWAMNEYGENNEHRHISHLYCAWPAHEAQNDERLIEACGRAIENRNRENKGKDDTASHGWVHKALVAARLKDGNSAYELLHALMSGDIFFSSLMTDHNTDRSIGVYCTDTSIGLVGIVNEMLVYSNTGIISLLPALPSEWKQGSIDGLMARTNARVSKLEWDLDAGKITASILSFKAQKIRVVCLNGRGRVEGDLPMPDGTIEFAENEEIAVAFYI